MKKILSLLVLAIVAVQLIFTVDLPMTKQAH